MPLVHAKLPLVSMDWTAADAVTYGEFRNSLLEAPGRCMHNSRGFTLIELIVTIAILAIVLSIAVPNLQTFVQRNRLVAATNNLVSSLAMARSEAVKRAARVTVSSANWTAGWQVYVDTGTIGSATGDTVLRVYQANVSGAPSVTPNANFSSYISYLPSGVTNGNGGSSSGSFSICKDGASRVISINATGRASTAPGTC